MPLTHDEVAAVAALANLELDPSEVELFARQLGEILAYADDLRKVDTAGVPPTSAIGAGAAGAMGHAVDRPDDLRASLEIADTLANAPDPDDLHGLFKVPRVIG
jgi:aspartyl-tRNA(Asn)/glutamyl-tRNA(Gln) amidotransferase subunit C